MSVQTLLESVKEAQAFLTDQLLAAGNSGTLNTAGVNRVGEQVVALFADYLDCRYNRQPLYPSPPYRTDGSISEYPLGDLLLQERASASHDWRRSRRLPHATT